MGYYDYLNEDLGLDEVLGEPEPRGGRKKPPKPPPPQSEDGVKEAALHEITGQEMEASTIQSVINDAADALVTELGVGKNGDPVWHELVDAMYTAAYQTLAKHRKMVSPLDMK